MSLVKDEDMFFDDDQEMSSKEKYLKALKVWRQFIDESMETLGINKEAK